VVLGTLGLDYLENASIVSLAIAYPEVGDLHFYASRLLTLSKWLGIASVLLMTLGGSLRFKRNLYLLSAAAALLITIADWAVIHGIRAETPSAVHAGFFGSLLFPLLAAGYWKFYRAVADERPRLGLAFFVAGAYLAAISTLIQGSTGLLEHLRLQATGLHLEAGPIFDVAFSLFKKPLYALGLALTVAESVLFAIIVWKRTAGLPRRLIFIDRLVVVVVFAVVAKFAGSAGLYLLLLSPNLSHVILFAALARDPAATER
jgi:hypothetical protein